MPNWVSDVFMKNKKKRSRRFDMEKRYGFRLMIHERDWIAGRTIRANIMDGIEKSRRVIFILSRYITKKSHSSFSLKIQSCQRLQ